MATKKITITVPEETLVRLKAISAAEGVALSTYIAQACEHRVRSTDGLAALREWDAASGPVSDENLAWADEQIARAERHARADEPDMAPRQAS